jgi:uncharacterized protein (DUF488 family)
MERFMDLLNLHAVTAVCDVRSQPYSGRNPQFNRDALQRKLTGNGIAYLFLGSELGAKSADPSCSRNGIVRFGCLSRTGRFKDGLQRVRAAMETHRVALMCAEKDPLLCHRTLLICRSLRNEGMSIKHILADGSIETQAELEARLLMITRVPRDDLFMDHAQSLERAYDLQSEKIAHAGKAGGTGPAP